MFIIIFLSYSSLHSSASSSVSSHFSSSSSSSSSSWWSTLDSILKCPSNLLVGLCAVSTSALVPQFPVAFCTPIRSCCFTKEIDRALLLELRIVHLQRRGYSFDLALPIQPDGDPEFFSTQHYPAGLSLGP